jgi:hypothetical protein
MSLGVQGQFCCLSFLSTKFHRTLSIFTLVVAALNLLYATKPLHGGDEMMRSLLTILFHDRKLEIQGFAKF